MRFKRNFLDKTFFDFVLFQEMLKFLPISDAAGVFVPNAPWIRQCGLRVNDIIVADRKFWLFNCHEDMFDLLLGCW